jgi:mannose-6-phosphate isomerase-like protein (cupin superfamily)
MPTSTLLPLADLRSSPTAWLFEGRRRAGVDLSLFVTSTPPGGGPDLHVHPCPEVFLVQEARARFTIGDGERAVEAGHVLVIPAGTPHRFENVGEDTLGVVGMHPGGEVRQTDVEP